MIVGLLWIVSGSQQWGYSSFVVGRVGSRAVVPAPIPAARGMMERLSEALRFGGGAGG